MDNDTWLYQKQIKKWGGISWPARTDDLMPIYSNPEPHCKQKKPHSPIKFILHTESPPYTAKKKKLI